jgi:hypothetical protein
MATNTNNEKQDEWQKKEIGVLWKKESKTTKEKYITGVFNFKNIPGFPDVDVQIVGFSNKRKEKDTHPDVKCYISEPRDKKPAPAAPRAAAPAPTPTPTPAPVAATAPAPDNDLL